MQAHAELEAECESLKDSAAQARSELEGTAHAALLVFLTLHVVDLSSFAEFRVRSLAQFIDLQERLKVSNSAIETLERATDPVLEVVFPGCLPKE